MSFLMVSDERVMSYVSPTYVSFDLPRSLCRKHICEVYVDYELERFTRRLP